MSLYQKIKDIEEEMSRTQKNKGTSAHLSILKAKLAKYRRELVSDSTKSGAGGGRRRIGFEIGKSGIARVGLVGFPSVGKSTLMTKLTSVHSEVAEHEFTTLTVVAGLIKHNNTKIQLLDMPGIIEGAKDGKGRGIQVISVAKTCDLILVVLDVSRALEHKRIIERELEGFGIRLNATRPDINIDIKSEGGINIIALTKLTRITDDQIKNVLYEYKIRNCTIRFKCDATIDDLIDCIESNRIFVPALYVINKIDQSTLEEVKILCKLPHSVPISADLGWNFDILVENIWDRLDLIRVYPKAKGQLPDLEEPIILKRSAHTVEDLCNKIHKSMMEQFKNAIVWGTSVKHSPKIVGKEHSLADEDIVHIIKKTS